MGQSWRLEALEDKVATLTEAVSNVDKKLENITVKLEEAEDRRDVRAEVAVGDIAVMLEDQSGDIVAKGGFRLATTRG